MKYKLIPILTLCTLFLVACKDDVDPYENVPDGSIVNISENPLGTDEENSSTEDTDSSSDSTDVLVENQIETNVELFVKKSYYNEILDKHITTKEYEDMVASNPEVDRNYSSQIRFESENYRLNYDLNKYTSNISYANYEVDKFFTLSNPLEIRKTISYNLYITNIALDFINDDEDYKNIATLFIEVELKNNYDTYLLFNTNKVAISGMEYYGKTYEVLEPFESRKIIIPISSLNKVPISLNLEDKIGLELYIQSYYVSEESKEDLEVEDLYKKRLNLNVAKILENEGAFND